MTIVVRLRVMDEPRRPSMGGLMTRPEAASFLGVSVSSLAHWSCHGKGPARMLIGRRTYYSIADLDTWLRSRAIAMRGR